MDGTRFTKLGSNVIPGNFPNMAHNIRKAAIQKKSQEYANKTGTFSEQVTLSLPDNIPGTEKTNVFSKMGELEPEMPKGQMSLFSDVSIPSEAPVEIEKLIEQAKEVKGQMALPFADPHGAKNLNPFTAIGEHTPYDPRNVIGNRVRNKYYDQRNTGKKSKKVSDIGDINTVRKDPRIIEAERLKAEAAKIEATKLNVNKPVKATGNSKFRTNAKSSPPTGPISGSSGADLSNNVIESNSAVKFGDKAFNYVKNDFKTIKKGITDFIDNTSDRKFQSLPKGASEPLKELENLSGKAFKLRGDARAFRSVDVEKKALGFMENLEKSGGHMLETLGEGSRAWGGAKLAGYGVGAMMAYQGVKSVASALNPFSSNEGQ